MVLYMKTYVNLWQCLPQFFLEWEMFHTNVVEKIRTQCVFNYFFWKSCRLWDNVEKYCKNGHVTLRQYNMVHRPHTPIICNTYCYSTAKMVTRTRLNDTILRKLSVWFLHTNVIPNGTHRFDAGILRQRSKWTNTKKALLCLGTLSQNVPKELKTPVRPQLYWQHCLYLNKFMGLKLEKVYQWN
jgi:hypothetical protein